MILLLARTGLRAGEACGLRWRDVTLTAKRPRLSVVWQLNKWGELVRPKSRTARRTLPLRLEVVEILTDWRGRQTVWADRLGEEWATITTSCSRPGPGVLFGPATSPGLSHEHKRRRGFGTDR